MVCDRCGKAIDTFAVRQEDTRGVLCFHSPCFRSFLADGKLGGNPDQEKEQRKNDEWDFYANGWYPTYPMM
jgi:hypothetical protein